MRRWTLLLVTGVLVTGGVLACGDPLRPYPQFTINPRSMTLAAGATRDVKIVLAGPNKEDTWTVVTGDGSVATAAQTATGATVSAKAAGTTRMYVVSQTAGFGEVRDSATVIVTP